MPAAKIGHVSERQYEKLVAKALEHMETMTSCQFTIGEIALKIEPIGTAPGGVPRGVYATLQRFAEDIDAELNTVISWRSVAAAWPKGTRVRNVSYGVFKQLAPLPDRFERIKNPPLDERTGQRRWTWDAAAREAGHTPNHPVSVAEKVNRIHDLARDDDVAATAVSDMLRRPDVAHRVVADPTSRHMINRAHIDRAHQTEQVARERTPAIRQIEHSIEVIELLGSCAAFVSTMNRVLPQLHEHPLRDDEQAALHDNLDRVHAAESWCRTVIDTGDTSMDEQLAKLLRGD